MGKQVCQEPEEIPQVLQADMFGQEKEWTSLQIWIQGFWRHKGSLALDKENKNKLWKEAIKEN